MNSPFKNVTKERPCPICTKLDYCFYNDIFNGCRRSLSGIVKYDKNGVPYSLHPIEENRRIREPLSQDKLATIYQEFVKATLDQPLSEQHYQNLTDRGLTPNEIVKRGYFSLNQENRKIIISKFLSSIDKEELIRVPGIFENYKTKSLDIISIDGIAIPVRNYCGSIIAFKIRRDSSSEGAKYIYLSSKKFGGASSGSHLHVPLNQITDYSTIRITEGELKADLSTIMTGTLTIGVPGVMMWSKAYDFLKTHGVKKIYLAFDQDFKTNPDVGLALENAATSFCSAGYQVEVEVWR